MEATELTCWIFSTVCIGWDLNLYCLLLQTILARCPWSLLSRICGQPLHCPFVGGVMPSIMYSWYAYDTTDQEMSYVSTISVWHMWSCSVWALLIHSALKYLTSVYTDSLDIRTYDVVFQVTRRLWQRKKNNNSNFVYYYFLLDVLSFKYDRTII